MPNFDQTQSPRAQGYQNPQSEDDEDAIFKKGFGDLAFKALTKGFPELGADVVTFRVLDAKAQEGRGLGAFILKRGTELLYVPVVVSDNAVKPLDMFYSKTKDRFYPLTPDYLRYVEKGTLTSIGEPVKRPPTLRSDAMLRINMPSTMIGRAVYASAQDEDAQALVRSLAMNDGHSKHAAMLPDIMAKAPSEVRAGFEAVLNKHASVRTRAIEVYGKTALAMMFARTAKTAATLEVPMKHDVFLMTATTPIQEAKAELGRDVGVGFKAVALNGFYIKDKRKKTDNLFALAERPVELSVPSAPGLFKVFLTEGRAETALVVPNPVEFDGHMKLVPAYRGNKERRVDTRYLVIFKDGRSGVLDKIVGEHIVSTSSKDVESFLSGKLTDAPTNKDYGCLIAVSNMTVRASEPTKATDVTSDADTISFKREYGRDRIILDRGIDTNRVITSNDAGVWQFGGRFKWLGLKEDDWKSNKTFRLRDTDFLSTQEDILRAVERELLRRGGEPVEAKTAGERWVIGNDGKLLDYPQAVQKLAVRYNASIPDAVATLKLARVRDRSTVWAVKRATGEQPPQEDPNAQATMDPAMMAAMQGPPPPSPLDLAVGEQMQVLQQQQAALAQQMQMLQTVQMRSQQIGMGGGPMAAPMAAASMMGGPAPGPGGMPAMSPIGPMPGVGGQPVAPSQGQPSMMGAPMEAPGMDPSQQGQPGMDPSQQGMQGQPGMGAPGIDPSQQGVQGQPGVDPSQQGQLPPPPVMTDQLTSENVASQINPDFLDQAGALNSDDVFDAAAVASIAQQRNLRDLTQAYVPTLDRALDNLGRILLLFYIHEASIKEQLGGDDYTEIEQRLRDVFRGMGEVLTKVDLSASQLLPDSVNHG